MTLKIQKSLTVPAITLLSSTVLAGCFPTFDVGQSQANTSPPPVTEQTTTQPIENQPIAQGTNQRDALAQLRSTKQCPGCNLQGVDLERADLSGANLSNANLTRADLEKANLKGANLDGANLTRADLEEANLTNANLRNANFTSADLA